MAANWFFSHLTKITVNISVRDVGLGVNPFDLLPNEIDDFFHFKAMESKTKKKSKYGDRVLSEWDLDYIALPDLAKVT